MKNKNMQYVLYAFGVVLGISMMIISMVFLNGDEVEKVSGMILGLGAGICGGSLAMVINVYIENKNPELKRKKDIEVNDERNKLVKSVAGAKVNSIMFAVIILATWLLVLLDVPPVVTTIMSALILIQGILYVFTFNYYNNRI